LTAFKKHWENQGPGKQQCIAVQGQKSFAGLHTLALTEIEREEMERAFH
jgi:hypothetical protein